MTARPKYSDGVRAPLEIIEIAPCKSPIRADLLYAWLAHFKGKLSNMDGRAPPSTRDGAIKWPSRAARFRICLLV